MVSAKGAPDSTDGDGVHRPFEYAKFRTDKAASPGYSAELVSNRVEKMYVDDLSNQPVMQYGGKTLFEMFKQTVQERAN